MLLDLGVDRRNPKSAAFLLLKVIQQILVNVRNCILYMYTCVCIYMHVYVNIYTHEAGRRGRRGQKRW